MPNDPWAEFRGGSTVAPSRGTPQPVFTAPRTAEQDAEEARRNAEQARADARLGNEGARIDLARDANERAAAAEQRAATAAQRGTVDQGRAAGFLIRAINADRNFSRLDVGPRGIVGQAFAESFPNISNSYIDSADRQLADQTEREFIAGILRYDSGAAIPEDEYTQAGRIYFPRPGDTPEVIAAKAESRRVAIRGLAAASGVAGERVIAETGWGEEERQAAPVSFNTGPSVDGRPPLTYTPDGTPVWWVDANGAPIRGEDGKPLPEEGGYGLDMTTGETRMFGRASAPADDPTAGMGVLESIGEAITGNARSTPEIEALPDWATMPELNQLSGDSFMAALGTMVTDPAETAQILQSRFPGMRVRQDANGNYILRSPTDGQEYGIRPGFRVSDIPRAGGAIAAFTPAGRAATFGNAALAGAGTQAAIEASQVASGGNFDVDQVAMAGAAGPGGLALQRSGSAIAQRVRSALPRREISPARQQAADTVEAANRANQQTGANMQLLPADVGGPGVRNATGGAGKLPVSASMIGRARDRLTDEAERARDALARLVGPVERNVENAGERGLAGAQSYIRNSRTRVNALYAKARAQGGDEPVDLAGARQVLDEHIAELSQTPGGATGLKEMRVLRAELEQPFPVEGVRRMRTQMRDKFIRDGLRSSDLERRMGMVSDAADEDIANALTAAGKVDAAEAYRAASSAHAERLSVIDTVLAPIIGNKGSAPRSGEQIVAAIEQAAGKNSARLASFFNALPAEDSAALRASLIARLGAPAAGQASEETTFSMGRMLTQWNNMTDRSKSALFGGELRAAMDDLAKVASARREADRFVNFSNTGSVMGQLATGGALAGAITNPWTLAFIALDATTGAVLSSPKFTRWLARMPADPRAAQGHVANLIRVAAADALHGAEIISFQQALARQLEQSGARVTANQMHLAAEQTQSGDTTSTQQVPR